MFVAMIASECARRSRRPAGWARSSLGTSRELELRGNAVEIILPRYDCLRADRIDGLTVVYEDRWVPVV